MASRVRLAVVGAALGLMAGAVLNAGCTSWLDADDGTEDPAEAEGASQIGVPVVLPNAPAEVGGDGPYVPATPGLRVPNAGYWTRARLDANDVILPYTWVSLLLADDKIVIRIEAVLAADKRDPALQAVIPIALPGGGDVSTLVGLELGASALAQGVIALRTSESDIWLVTATHLRFDRVQGELVTGTIEGDARRGLRGQRVRHFEAGFVALRAPSNGLVAFGP